MHGVGEMKGSCTNATTNSNHCLGQAFVVLSMCPSGVRDDGQERGGCMQGRKLREHLCPLMDNLNDTSRQAHTPVSLQISSTWVVLAFVFFSARS